MGAQQSRPGQGDGASPLHAELDARAYSTPHPGADSFATRSPEERSVRGIHAASKGAAEEEEHQEFSVSFGYHCRGYYETVGEAHPGAGPSTSGRALSSPRYSDDVGGLPFSACTPSATISPVLGSLPGQAHVFQSPQSSSLPSTEARRRSSSFSFLSGAALGANATLANSCLVSSSYARAVLLDMDSPKAFRHIRCPARSVGMGPPSASSLGGGSGYWVLGANANASPQDHSHHHYHHYHHQHHQQQQAQEQQQQALHKFIGIAAPQRINGPSSSWSLNGSGCPVGSAGSSGSAGSNSSMSNSAPDLMGPSFLVASDVQVAGGAAGEDRVQAVCSEENGWLFCGVYDGFNGRDAADFLAANLYENIGMHLRLLQWRGQAGETAQEQGAGQWQGQLQQGPDAQGPALAPGLGPGATGKPPPYPVSSGGGPSPPASSLPTKPDDRRRQGAAASCAPREDSRNAEPCASASGLDLSFLQPWVLCSCGSSLCECPLHQTGRLSAAPALPTVREDEGPGSHHPQLRSQQQLPPIPGPSASALGGTRTNPFMDTMGWRVAEHEGPGSCRSEHSRGEGSPAGPLLPGAYLVHQQQLQNLEQFQHCVSTGLRRAVAHTERDFFRMVEQEMEERPDLTMVGSCVLALLIHGQHLFSLNLGDSRAVLATWSNQSSSLSSSLSSTSSSCGSMSRHSSGSGIAALGGSERNRLSSQGHAPAQARGLGEGSTERGPMECPGCLLAAEPASLEGHAYGEQQGSREPRPAAGLGAAPAVSSRSKAGREQSCWQPETDSELSTQQPGTPHAHGPQLRAVQLSETHCVDYEPERDRVAREHPADANAIVGRRVKGKLRVTRAFGAGYLKSEKMNNSLMGIFRVRDLQSPPYVSSEPYVVAHRLSPLDQFVVIGSDGLFDFFSNDEVVDYVARFLSRSPHADPAKFLLEQLLIRAAERAGKTLDELKSIPRGKRRKYHDDTTVIVITLGHTFRTSSASTLL